MGTLKDQIILVTGAAGAVGSATVRAIVESGGRAIAVDTNAPALQKLFADESSVEPATLDVASEEGWATLGTAISDSWGGLDGLVTCAAVLHPDDGPLGSLTREVWDQTQAINATGAMLASQAAVVLMRNRGGGSIVHVSSITAIRGSLTAQIAYTASKGALNALSREMAVAYAPDAIRVNTISPGLLHTALTSELVAVPRELARRLAHIPLGRLGLPSDVAEAAIWLLSDASTYVTGADLVIDGGLSAAFVTGRE